MFAQSQEGMSKKNKTKMSTTYLSKLMATKLKIDAVLQITSMAM